VRPRGRTHLRRKHLRGRESGSPWREDGFVKVQSEKSKGGALRSRSTGTPRERTGTEGKSKYRERDNCLKEEVGKHQTLPKKVGTTKSSELLGRKIRGGKIHKLWILRYREVRSHQEEGQT